MTDPDFTFAPSLRALTRADVERARQADARRGAEIRAWILSILRDVLARYRIGTRRA